MLAPARVGGAALWVPLTVGDFSGGEGRGSPSVAGAAQLLLRDGRVEGRWIPLLVADGELVAAQRSLGRGRVILVGVALTDHSNRDFGLWPYFNHLAFTLSSGLTGRPLVAFGDWRPAPIASSATIVVLSAVLLVAWIVTLLLFIYARRYSRGHPEQLRDFFVRREVRSPRRSRARESWQAVGFTRPLAGFLTLTAALFLLFVPYYWLTNVLIPNDVLPFPQSRGMWDFAWEALQLFWFIFDMGTLVAFIKYFAEYRVKDQAAALRSAQFYVWWQILTGLVQVTAAILVAVFWLPHTSFSYGSSLVILVALSQYPGFFYVVSFFFQAYQRFDYNIGLDMLSEWVLRFALAIPFVLLFRRWGAANPEYGEAFGAAIGLGVGYHVATIGTFLIGIVLYRRLGLRLTPLFLAHFTAKTIKRMLSFGLRVVIGKALFRAADFVDKLMLAALLLNYTEWIGLRQQILKNLMFLMPIAYRFFETAMAALAESYENGKKRLAQYYLVRFYQVGWLYAAIALSVIFALGPTFVEQVMDPQWARAADYLKLTGVVGAFFAAAWLSDMLQKGAGRPGLFAVMIGVEQAARISLFAVLIPLYQFTGYWLAYLLTIVLKVLVAWIVNHRLILRLRLYPWQMFVAPLITGLANYGTWRLIDGWLAPDGRLAVMLFFFGAALLSFFICWFICGLIGGHDAQFARELDSASRMTGPLKWLTRLFYYAARAGWSISPLHSRFPVTIASAALEEAAELQQALEHRTG